MGSVLGIYYFNGVPDKPLLMHDPCVAHQWALARSTKGRAAKAFHRYYWIDASNSPVRPRIVLLLSQEVNKINTSWQTRTGSISHV